MTAPRINSKDIATSQALAGEQVGERHYEEAETTTDEQDVPHWRKLLKTLRDSGIGLNLRGIPSDADVDAGIELQVWKIRPGHPGYRQIDRRLVRRAEGVVVDVRPDFGIAGDILDYCAAQIGEHLEVGMAAVIGPVPQSVDFRAEQQGEVAWQSERD